MMRRNACVVAVLIAVAGCAGRGSGGAASSAPPGDSAIRAYIVRHGQAVRNVDHPQGLTDAALEQLTATGKGQARELGRSLAGKGIAVVLTSPVGRARETAEIIATEIGLPGVTVEQGLIPLQEGEAGRGMMQGGQHAWREAAWRNGRDPRPPGGESMEDGVRRAQAVLRAAQKAHPGQAVVVVSHGDIVAGILGEADGLPVAERWAKEQIPAGTLREIRVTEQGVARR